MEYYTNHCWCSASNWDSDFFDCRFLITINKDVDKEFEDMLVTKKVFMEEDYNRYVSCMKKALPEVYISIVEKDSFKKGFYKKYNALSEEVLQWLMDNVEDNKEGKTWCIGDDNYLSTGYAQQTFTFFFKRRKDAMAFVKHWSKYKKPTTYFDYFRDKRKELNLETGKYIVTQR